MASASAWRLPPILRTAASRMCILRDVYKRQVEGKDNMQFTAVVRCQKSTDGGKTWGAYTTVFPEEGTFCRQPIQVPVSYTHLDVYKRQV